MIKFTTILTLMILVSCSSLNQLRVKSTPNGADVYVRSPGSSEKKLVGKTPLQVSSSDLYEKLNTKGLIVISIEKEKYYHEEFYLSDYSHRTIDIAYNLRLLPKIDQAHKVDEIIAELFECQKFIKVKRIKECKSILAKLKEKFPEVSTIYEFEGNIFFMNNEKKKALESFVTALKYNPKNQDARRMINIIKGSN